MTTGAGRHAKFGGSNAHRWLACPASVKDDAPPRPSSIYAEEGTEAHALFAECLRTNNPPRLARTPEIRDSVQFALDVIDDLRAEGFEITTVEQYERYPQSVWPAGDCGGTPDVTLERGAEALVLDFKHGAGVAVVDWHQHAFYGAARYLGRAGLQALHFATCQPRTPVGSPVKRTTIHPLELAEFHTDVLDALARAKEPDAPEIPGPHCHWCPRELICKARERAALQVAHDTFAGVEHVDMTVLPAVQDLPIAKLAKLLESADLLRSYLSEAEKYALELARGGTDVPGFKVVEAQARRQWAAEHVDVTVAKLFAMLPDNALAEGDEWLATWERFAPRQMVGITEAEALLVKMARDAAPRGQKQQAAAAMKERFAFLTTKKSSGNLTLVPLSDSRPAVNRAQQLFGSVALPAPEGDE